MSGAKGRARCTCLRQLKVRVISWLVLARTACPTLLLHAEESFLESPAGLAGYFQQARTETISGAGHWLHHEKPDEVLGAMRTFLGLTEEGR